MGPKTAVKWLTQYGSLDNIIAHADEFKGAIGDNLRKALDWFDTARQLITIKCDVDLPVRITDLAPKPQDTGKLILLYEQLDMKASLRELRQQQSNLNQSESGGSNENLAVSAADNGNKDAIQTHSGTYQTIFTEDELNDWLIRLDAAQLVSVDSETTSLSPMQAKLVGISFCIENHLLQMSIKLLEDGTFEYQLEGESVPVFIEPVQKSNDYWQYVLSFFIIFSFVILLIWIFSFYRP